MADQGARDEALEKAKQFSRKATEKERLYIEARYALVIEKNPDKRYRILRELLGKYPSEKYAHFELGQYYDQRKLFTGAAASYEKALALDPNFGLALNQVASHYAKMGDLGRAIRSLERYAALSPGDPNPRDSLADIFMRMGNLEASVAQYKEVLAARPDFFTSWESLAYVYALQEDYTEALRCLDELVARAPAASAKWLAACLRAYVRDILGQWDRAAAAGPGPEGPGRAGRRRLRPHGHQLDARLRSPRPGGSSTRPSGRSPPSIDHQRQAQPHPRSP